MRKEKTVNPIIGKLEKLGRNLITAFNRRLAPCDSHIRICYFCVLLRFHLRRKKPQSFWINMKHVTYVFTWRSKVTLSKVFVSKELRGTIEYWKAQGGRLINVFTHHVNVNAKLEHQTRTSN